METNFGASAPYTVGVEEEFQLVDPGTLGLAPLVDRVMASMRPGDEDLVTSELSSSCIEMRSPVYGSVSGLAAGLPGLRRRVKGLAGRGGARFSRRPGRTRSATRRTGRSPGGSTTGGSRRRWAG